MASRLLERAKNGMAVKTERVKVEITESTTGDIRTISINLTAPAGDFLLTDLLKQRGVIEPLEVQLRQVVKSATENYLSEAESMVAGLASESKATRQPRTNGNTSVKSSRNGNQKERTGVTSEGL